MTIQATLCYIRKNNKVLLQKKSKGLYGGDKYNDPGGKLKPEENPEEGAKREIEEETGLKVENLIKHGEITFYEGEIQTWLVHVFATENFSGEIKINHREGVLEWIDENKMPFENMWVEDRFWVPLLLEQKKFKVKFYFNENSEKLLNKEIEIIN